MDAVSSATTYTNIHTSGVKKPSGPVFKQPRQKSQGESAGEFLPVIENKLKAIAEKSNNKFSVDDIKQFFKNCGIDLNEIVQNKDIDLDRFFANWEKRILECKTNEDLNVLAKEFSDAKKMGLAGILKKYLPRGVANLDQVTDEQLEKAIVDFVNENSDKLKDANNTKKFLKIFHKLLDGTEDKDKIRLWNAFKKVAAENKQVSEVLDAIILSIAKSKDVQNFINQIPAEALEALGLSKDELISSLKVLVENSDEKNLQRFRQEIEKKVEEFYQKNGEALQSIKSKIQAAQEEAKANGRTLSDEEVLALLTEEEQKLYQAFITIKSLSTGFITGSTNNKIVDDSVKIENINGLYEKLKQFGCHEDVLAEVKTYINNHKEEFTNSDNLTELLDKATGGAYSQLQGGQETQMPVEQGLGTASDIGYVLPTQNEVAQQQSKVAVLREKYLPQEEKKLPTVEKTTKDYTYVQAIKEMGFSKTVQTIKEFGKVGIESAAATIAREYNDKMQVYYANMSNCYALIEKVGTLIHGWSDEQIKELNLCFTQKQNEKEKTESYKKEQV